jgi:hypothetical protein
MITASCGPVELPHVAGGAAGWTARPQKPIAGSDGRADGWREQHRHPLGLPLVPNGNEVVGVLEDLPLGRTALVRIPVFLHFALSLSLKIVWAARSDQVQLPSVADSPRARHRLRRELAVEVF